MNNKLLIVGVDPGTTVGYAVLDLEGNIVKIGSEKELSLNNLISKITPYGKVLLVGTDKKKTPGFVEKFKTKVGAKILPPKEDLKVTHKQLITKEHRLKNSHEMDALASALFARDSIKNTIEDLENLFSKNIRDIDFQKIIETQLLYPEKNIKKTVENLEKPTIKNPKPLKQIQKNYTHTDYLGLLDKTRRIEKDFLLLKKHNQKLSKQIEYLKRKEAYFKNKILDLQTHSREDPFKDQKINSLYTELNAKNDHIDSLQNELTKIRSLILKNPSYIILKKLKNLGKEEFSRRGAILNLQDKDLLLVEDPNIISSNTIEQIKEKVSIIIHKKALSQKNQSNNPFVFIPANKLNIKEDRYFALADKKEFEAAKNSADMLQKVIHDYQKERSG